MKKIIIDCHNHTRGSKFDTNIKGSDWFDYVEDYAEIAREGNFAMCAITEHDTVNRKLKELLFDTEIIVPEAVEISAKNYDRDKALHILYYAKSVSENVDLLLEGVLDKKKQMLKLQIDKLSDMWFQINFEDVYDYVKQCWFWEDWMNKWWISKFLFEGKNRDFNTIYLYSIFKNINLSNHKNIYSWFYNNCMKSWWAFYDEYKVRIPAYEPSVEEIWNLVKKDNAIISIAHPNFTFKKWVEEFEKELPYYLEKWVNAIEFNAKVDYKWGKVIMECKEKYDLILTFWSDCHQIWWNDDKHATFWTMSSFLNDKIIKENYKKFREKIWI